MPVIYDKKAGNSGNTHGDINDKNPAPNAIKILISDIVSHRPPHEAVGSIVTKSYPTPCKIYDKSATFSNEAHCKVGYPTL